jgi:predicted  nucleic acid-binding Zn-ribbon protein
MDKNFSNELMISFGKLESSMDSINKRLDKQEENIDKRFNKQEDLYKENQKMIYKLIENEHKLIHLVDDIKELKKDFNINENDNKKKISDLSKKVEDNEKVVKNVKWVFGILLTILLGVTQFGLKEILFGK